MDRPSTEDIKKALEKVPVRRWGSEWSFSPEEWDAIVEKYRKGATSHQLWLDLKKQNMMPYKEYNTFLHMLSKRARERGVNKARRTKAKTVDARTLQTQTQTKTTESELDIEENEDDNANLIFD